MSPLYFKIYVRRFRAGCFLLQSVPMGNTEVLVTTCVTVKEIPATKPPECVPVENVYPVIINNTATNVRLYSVLLLLL